MAKCTDILYTNTNLLGEREILFSLSRRYEPELVNTLASSKLYARDTVIRYIRVCMQLHAGSVDLCIYVYREV